MSELNAGDCTLLLDEFDQTLQRFDKGVVPNAEIAQCAAAAPLHFGRFDDDQTRAACCELAGVHQMPVGRKPLDRGILVHRRHDDSIAHLHIAYRQWRKQQRPRHFDSLLHSLDLANDIGSCRRRKAASAARPLSLRPQAMQFWDGVKPQDAIAKDRP